MILKKTINRKIGDDTIDVHYEGVLQGEYAMTGEVAQFAVVVHDPDHFGGRRRAFLCDPAAIPVDHVQLGIVAIK